MTITRIGAPRARHHLRLAAPIERWDEAIPLGNGLTGALLWGDGRELRISLDRGDLWDRRQVAEFQRPDYNFATLLEAVRRGDEKLLLDLFDAPYSRQPYPTKIPAGRLVLTLDGRASIESFELNLAQATGLVHGPRLRVEAFCSAVQPVGMLRLSGARARLAITSPFIDGPSGGADSVTHLDYPRPTRRTRGQLTWLHQPCVDGFAYAIVVATRQVGRHTCIAFTIVTSEDHADLLAEGQRRVAAALDRGYDALHREHRRWWRTFWSRSAISVPDPAIEQHYLLARYYYGSASRRGAPPIPLQGVWTADEGTLPPWKGDYHHDLNTQLTYWPYATANHLDEGLCFLDWLWSRLPRARRFAREFFNAPGAIFPGVSDIDANPMGGWTQYSYSLTTMAWLAHSFYMHWRCTLDDEFLRQRAIPFCREAAVFLEAMLKPGDDGTLKLPLSTSPEIHGNLPKAWMKPNTNYDLSLMRWLFGALEQMQQAAGDEADARHWRGLLGRLGPLIIKPVPSVHGFTLPTLWVNEDEPLLESHRHFSHLMSIHPLDLVHLEGPDSEAAVNAMRHMDHLGLHLWVGFSFAWAAGLSAKLALPQRALAMLQMYLWACVSRNGFNLNGDFRQQGLIGPQYRPFTLEANFAAADAVHQMLMQSWGGVLRLFPAMPEAWRDAGFDSLRAEGALLVTARRRAGRVTFLSIVAQRGGELRLRDPFADAKPRWNRRDVRKVGNEYRCTLKPGESLQASCRA
jgi:alpha-L-fucosidase 2